MAADGHDDTRYIADHIVAVQAAFHQPRLHEEAGLREYLVSRLALKTNTSALDGLYLSKTGFCGPWSLCIAVVASPRGHSTQTVESPRMDRLCFHAAVRQHYIGTITEQQYFSSLIAHLGGVRNPEDSDLGDDGIYFDRRKSLWKSDNVAMALRNLALKTTYNTVHGKLGFRYATVVQGLTNN